VTTRFRNPWVDPRVLDLRPAEVEAYLRRHGWQEADSAVPQTKRFLSPVRGSDREAVLVPGAVDDGPLANLLVECVGKLAAWEDRYAGEVLNDLLGTPSGVPSNGAASPRPAGNARPLPRTRRHSRMELRSAVAASPPG
jgi:hypothetical protein